MPRDLSTRTSTLWNSDSIDDPIVALIVIDAPGVRGSPFRLVQNKATHSHKGFLFEGASLQAVIPEEGETKTPEMELVASNVDKKFITLLTAQRSFGAATVSLILVRDSNPDEEDPYETLLPVVGISIDKQTITFSCSLSEIMEKTVVRITYNEMTAAGLYE